VRADFAQGRRVAAVRDRAADVFENHLLPTSVSSGAGDSQEPSDSPSPLGSSEGPGIDHHGPNSNILTHFFLEGLLLTLGSGLIGMGLATGLMAMMAGVRGPQGFDPPKLVPMSAMLAIGSLTLAGVIAGLYPARRAAMLQPVEALRQE